MTKIIKASPTLRARDIKTLAEWYRDSLGFTLHFLWGTPVTFGMVGRDDIEFGIACRTETFGPVTCYQFVRGVDALHAEWVARGVKPNRPPTVQPYQMKDFDLTDPDGNTLCFGESTEDCEPGKA